jgi:hypothetical protein
MAVVPMTAEPEPAVPTAAFAAAVEYPPREHSYSEPAHSPSARMRKGEWDLPQMKAGFEKLKRFPGL